MNKELSSLYPSILWENFAHICSIPTHRNMKKKLLLGLKSGLKK